MRNPYLKSLNKIEFVLTYACTGVCKHCSQGDHAPFGARIDADIAKDAVRRIAEEYDIKTVMVFGGEPLLHTEAVYAVMNEARKLNIAKRQVITNGYFSKSREMMREVAFKLSECGVNDLLLSVDAFHQEAIPLDTVLIFAEEIQHAGVPIRLQPAWLVSPEDDNPYNAKTRELLGSFLHLGIAVNGGNVIYPEGNARIFLPEYFNWCFKGILLAAIPISFN